VNLNTLDGNFNLISMGPPCRRLADHVMELFGLFEPIQKKYLFTFRCSTCGQECRTYDTIEYVEQTTFFCPFCEERLGGDGT
jgi:hypothetical protein